MLYPKYLYYNITDPSCTRSIKIDVQKCKTISDLKKEIALDLHLTESDFQINNPYDSKPLAEIPVESRITVNITNRSNNIDFIFPDYSRIQITNGYSMTLDEVLQYFEQKRVHFSSACKRSIKFTISNQEVPQAKYPFLSVPSLAAVQIKMPCQAVFITYDDTKFIFSENESVSEAEAEIKGSYPGCSSVSIRDILGHRFDFWQKLKSGENYEVSVSFDVTFHSKDELLVFTKRINFFATVDEVKLKVANEISKKGDVSVDPKEVVVCDSSKRVVLDTDQFLRNVQNLSDVFYFEINTMFFEAKEETACIDKNDGECESYTYDYSEYLSYSSPSSSQRSNKKHRRNRGEYEDEYSYCYYYYDSSEKKDEEKKKKKKKSCSSKGKDDVTQIGPGDISSDLTSDLTDSEDMSDYTSTSY